MVTKINAMFEAIPVIFSRLQSYFLFHLCFINISMHLSCFPRDLANEIEVDMIYLKVKALEELLLLLKSKIEGIEASAIERYNHVTICLFR